MSRSIRLGWPPSDCRLALCSHARGDHTIFKGFGIDAPRFVGYIRKSATVGTPSNRPLLPAAPGHCSRVQVRTLMVTSSRPSATTTWMAGGSESLSLKRSCTARRLFFTNSNTCGGGQPGQETAVRHPMIRLCRSLHRVRVQSLSSGFGRSAWRSDASPCGAGARARRPS